MKICRNNMSLETRNWLIFLIIIVTVTGGWLLLAEEIAATNNRYPPQRTKSKWSDDQLYGPYKGKSVQELWRERDEFFKAGKPPRDSSTVERVWQWYRAMDNADPTYRSKIPITFYGKVHDQYGHPVSDATVDMTWGKGTNAVILSEAGGDFRLVNVTGDFLDVKTYKQGHVEGGESRMFFNYWDIYDEQFYLPNPTNPVVFRLRKLEKPEPMYVWDPFVRIGVTGEVAWVDVGTGKRTPAGDVGFSVVRDELPGQKMSGYTLTVQAAEGGGLATTDEEFMFQAPVSGYVQTIIIREAPAKPSGIGFHVSHKLKFYVRTSDNKYAAVKVCVAQMQLPESHVDAMVYFNPSGSRNLELGADNRLDPAKVKPPKRAPATAAKGTGGEQN